VPSSARYLKENENKLAKRKAFVRGLERDVAKCKEAIAQAESKTQEHLSVIRALAGPVRALHAKLNSEELTQVLGKFLPAPLLNAAGKSAVAAAAEQEALSSEDSEELTPSQVLGMMGVIEQRITECVQFYQAHIASVRASNGGGGAGGSGANSAGGSSTSPREGGGGGKRGRNAFSRGPAVPSGKLKEQLETSLHKIMSITSNRPTRDIDPSEKPLSYEELKAQALAELKGIKT
jgi:hypothetical protein